MPSDRTDAALTSTDRTDTALTSTDLIHLRRCVDLAAEALADGDGPFGSLLVDASGEVRFEDRNREASTEDPTRHPEIEVARWAAAHLTREERAAATVYTSGEHCAMCAAAHAWVGLGRIVYAGSTAQLTAWRAEWGVPAGPVAPLSIAEVAPGVPTDGPVPAFEAELRELHRRSLGLVQGRRPPGSSTADHQRCGRDTIGR